VVYRPFLLGGVFQATGNRSPMEVPAKGQYMLTTCSASPRYGVPFAHNPHFPDQHADADARRARPADARAGPHAALRGCGLPRHLGRGPQNMNDPATVGAVLQQAGFDRPQATARAGRRPGGQGKQLKAVTQEAVARGVFGAPTFFVGDQMYWGQDRLDFVKEALAMSDILVHAEAGVMTITLNRLERKNSITSAMYGAWPTPSPRRRRRQRARGAAAGHETVFSPATTSATS
jgi:2-hydroxychromene-2-carboxylate isomerase